MPFGNVPGSGGTLLHHQVLLCNGCLRNADFDSRLPNPLNNGASSTSIGSIAPSMVEFFTDVASEASSFLHIIHLRALKKQNKKPNSSVQLGVKLEDRVNPF